MRAKRLEVAVVHDSFLQTGGGQSVAIELVRAFEGARLFTAALRPDRLPGSIAPEGVHSSFVQPLVRHGVPLSALAPLLPAAFRRMDLGEPDVVISSSAAFAHHVRIPSGAVHVCYCHTPPRFLWDPIDYFRGQRLRRVATAVGRAGFRRLDLAAARHVDLYVANSRYVAGRIRRIYGREPRVIYPPVDTTAFEPVLERSGRFIAVSRLRNQKRLDLAIEAANLAGLALDVVGEGPELARLRNLAGPTVTFLGRLEEDQMRRAMARSAAVVVPAAADFGLTIVEAQASGRPPIAFAAGGALEIIEDGRTGFLFDEQTPIGLARAMRRALEIDLVPASLTASARRFDVAVFRSEIRRAVELALERRAAPATASGYGHAGHRQSVLGPAGEWGESPDGV